jgi:Clp protease
MLHAQEILNTKRRLNDIYVKHTGQPLKKIEDVVERDTFLTAETAKDFGLVDKVIDRRPVEGLPGTHDPEKAVWSNVGLRLLSLRSRNLVRVE